MLKWVNTVCRKQEGNTIIIVAICMAVLIGFGAIAVDVGYLYSERAKMVTAADSGALAGAVKMFDTTADTASITSRAKEIAGANGVDTDKIEVSFPAVNEIEVKVKGTKGLFFAKVIGHDSADIGASARAKIGNFIGGRGVVPLGIAYQKFQTGQQFQLKLGAGEGGNGNYHALDFPNSSGADGYRNNFKYGYDGEIKLYQWIDTETGNMAGPTIESLKYRISQCASTCTYEQCISQEGCGCSLGGNRGIDVTGCPRVVLVPIVNDFNVNGNKPVQVIGFAAFYLENIVVEQGNNKAEVYGRFVRILTEGDMSKTPDYGTKVVKLTR